MPCLVFSQTLDEFRTAASSKGVNLIPFSKLRTDATAIADEVERRKGEAASYNYETLEKQKKNMLEEIKKRNDAITSLNKEIEEFKSKYPDGSASSFNEEIEKRKKQIEEYNGKVKDLNEKLSKGADTFDRLNQARAGLRELFQDALNQLSDVNSNADKYLGSTPTDDDRNKLKEYVGVISDQIKSEQEQHKVQEDGAKGRKEDFEKLIKMTE